MSHPDRPATLGQLRDTGYTTRTVKQEIRENLLDRLRSGETAFPGIVGFDDTVLPELETRAARRPRPRAARRARPGQDPADAHPRSSCSTSGAPSSTGCEINDDPLRAGVHPLPAPGRRARRRPAGRLAAPQRALRREAGHPRHQRRRPRRRRRPGQGRRRAARSATPRRCTTACVPRTNRGIFGLNELPDLAERIQVAMFNVLEERDIQVRGYSLRLPLDLLLVATANPEDYTNRGRIITPLKDRFGAEIRTHYPLEVDDEVALISQEAAARRRGARAPGRGRRPAHPRAARARPRSTSAPASRARFAIAAPRASSASALRRVGPRRRARGRRPHLRRADGRADAARQGRVRDGRGGPRARGAGPPAPGRRSPRRSGRGCPGSTCPASPTCSPRGRSSRPASWCRPPTCSARSARCRGCPRCSTGSATATTPRPGRSAAAVEFVLEGLHLTRRIDKDTVGGRTVYGA